MEVDLLPLQKATFGESWCTWCCWLPHLELLTAPNKILVSLPAIARWMVRMQRKHHLVSYALLMLLLLHLWHGVSALMARIQVFLRLLACTKCTANRNICTVSSSVAQGNRGYHKKETSGAHFFAVFLCLDDSSPCILAAHVIFMVRCLAYIHNIWESICTKTSNICPAFMVVGRYWALYLPLLCVWQNQVTAMQQDVCLNMKNMSKFLECLLITKNYGGRTGNKLFSHS